MRRSRKYNNTMAETKESSLLQVTQTLFGDGFALTNSLGHGRAVDEDRLREYYKTGGAHSTTGVSLGRFCFFEHQAGCNN